MTGVFIGLHASKFYSSFLDRVALLYNFLKANYRSKILTIHLKLF